MHTQVVAALDQIVKMVHVQEMVPPSQIELLVMSLLNLIFPLQDEVRQFLAGQLRKTGYQAALATLLDVMFLPQMPRVQRRLTDILLDVLPALLENTSEGDDKVLQVRQFIRRLIVALAGASLGTYVEPVGDTEKNDDSREEPLQNRIARHLPHDFVFSERRHGNSGAQFDDCRASMSQCVTLLRQMVMRQGNANSFFSQGRALLSTLACKELEVRVCGLLRVLRAFIQFISL